MTRTRTPASAAPSTGSTPVRSPYLLGILGAVQAGAASLLCLVAPVVLVWMASTTTGAVWTEAIRTAAAAWLLAHRAPLEVAGGATITLLPLGLTAVPAAWCWSAGRRLAHALQSLGRPDRSAAEPRWTTRRRPALTAWAAFTLTYAVGVGAVALLTGSPVLRPGAVAGALGAAVLAGAACGTALLRGLPTALTTPPTWRDRWPTRTLPGRRPPARRHGTPERIRPAYTALADLLRAPGWLRAGARAATLALGVWVAVAAALTAVAVLTSWGDVTGLRQVLAPGAAAGGLGLVEIAYLPTAVVWAAAWLAGPGFAVGVDTVVTPAATVLGPLPALPLLAALPDPAVTPGWWWGAVLVPVAAGALAGVRLVRAGPVTNRWARLPLTGVVAVLAGAGATVLAWLGTGSVGPERMAVAGPSPWRVGLAVALEVGAGCLIALLLTPDRAAPDGVPTGPAGTDT